ncbi:PEPxxWA-CTERM sorting domain-containing protein [Sphingomonas sp.]|uniref:PEPxxWA-CTERM sorting domain-containing protein n=1 Tax=Sphingomonas sp. TaxID=28214 RepID=UPI0025CF3DCC|nr:PEPxxWA-CTERM sorting domain-containing protein [Sphingomonas sp.]
MLSNPVADAANSAFLSSLTDVRSESFETYASGLTPSTLTFTGSGGSTTASLSGSGYVIGPAPRTAPFDIGTFATDGQNLMQLNGSVFTITFDQLVGGFGFYATDIETDAQIILTLGTGAIETYSFNTLLGSAIAGSGSVDFLGFTTLDGIKSLTVAHGPESDVLGFDNFQIGTLASAAPVPEPATWAMFIGGFGLVGGAMRRRMRTSVRFA